ncbi:hypothetical protein CRUP_034407 [Coryphaenoides rupestris]|nr:hypothetical protein CRUP_034407 [Coryphaenoides rupestris]
MDIGKTRMTVVRAERSAALTVCTSAWLSLHICNGSRTVAGCLCQKLPEHEVVHPTRVDAKGHFLSNFLPHHGRRIQRRQVPEQTRSAERVFYHLWHGGHSLHFNLSLNSRLLAPGFVTERRYGGLHGAKIHSSSSSLCHFSGEVWDGSTVKGKAAISTCDGLDAEQRRQRWEQRRGARRGRRVRQRSVTTEKWVETLVVADHKMVEYHSSQGVEGYVLAIMNIVSGVFRDASIGNSINIAVVRLILLEQEEDAEQRRQRWEQRRGARRGRRVRQRSVTTEKWVETLVVADHKMVEYHSSQGVEGYVLAIMNIVSGVFRDASIGNSINIAVVRLILLEQEEPRYSAHTRGPWAAAERLFCGVREELKVTHHADSSLRSFCRWQKGLNMKGDEHPLHHDVAVLLTRKDICTSINKPCETLGLSHVAGMCQPHRSCSINEDTGLPLAFTVAHELGHNRGWGWCLDDPPLRNQLSQTSMPPGVLYSAAHQCRLQYGPQSLLCDDVDNVCSTLWCTVGNTCHSKMDGAVDGTNCGEGKVRQPKYGGKYCLGERRRYRTCNKTPCLSDLPTFRDLQCGHFNTMAYKGTFHKWVAVNNRDNACELHCRPLNEHFSEKMLDAVADGTRCSEVNASRDICINGVCKNVGCDFVIGSNALEDRCGVCQGDGSTCRTVTKTFEESEGFGYVDIGLIPAGAHDIRVEEVAAAGNFLALRSDKPDAYFLNGGWTIQWNGEYKAAGAVFTYERTGHLENLTSPGPTMEPLWLQLLFQETNPGVRYEYTIRQEFSEDNTTVNWWAGEWQKCSSSCGLSGMTKRSVLCIQAVDLEERRSLRPGECKHAAKPESVSSCNTHIPCPAEWLSGSWTDCSLTCGAGVRRRNVTCSWSTGAACDLHRKPSATASCHARDCPVVVVADHFGGEDASGSGWTSKEAAAVNEINSIPDVDPNASQQTPGARVQPRAHDGLNNAIDAEFTRHHHVDKGHQPPVEKNVKVDDFYYDYNFINFHEDLSYDAVDSDNSVSSSSEEENDGPRLDGVPGWRARRRFQEATANRYLSHKSGNASGFCQERSRERQPCAGEDNAGA